MAHTFHGPQLMPHGRKKKTRPLNWFKLESWHLEFATHSGCLPFEAFKSLGFPSAFVQPRFIRGFPLLGQKEGPSYLKENV